jgi:hypothetical protein
MRIWKLMPIDPTAPIWKLWVPEPIFVRAESEAEARHLTQLATAKMLPAEFGKPIPINPWSKYKKLDDPAPLPTRCEDVTGQTNEFSAEGPAAVLRHGERS